MRLGLSQADVAASVGIAMEVYGRLERGRMAPSVGTLWRLRVALGMSTDAAFGLESSGAPATALAPAQPQGAGMRRLVRRASTLSPASWREARSAGSWPWPGCAPEDEALSHRGGLMRVHRGAALLLLAVVTGCASGRVVRLETGQGPPIVLTPPNGEAGPVEVERREFKQAVARLAQSMRPPANPQQAARHLMGVDARGGAYYFNQRTRQLTPLDGAALASDMPPADVELTRAYLRWCERTERKGDCLHMLVESPTVTGDGRYTLAMALAQGVVREEMLDAFRDMADPQAALSAVLWTLTFYLVLWSVPEPVSKGLAAVMTATAIVYLGVDTFWTLIAGFKRLMEAADRATTFDEVRDAGERYGKVMGQNAARTFALLATVSVGHTAAGFASKVPMLPGSAQASVLAGGRAGIRLAAVGEVGAVAVSGEAVTVALAPNAVTMTARAMGGAAAAPVGAKSPDHHIATNKWWESTNEEGPWSPKFQRIFDKAGMSLDDLANIVPVKGHKGPHPKEYHRRVLRRLSDATEGCRTMQQCREALTAELGRLGQEIATPGTTLNKLVTGT